MSIPSLQSTENIDKRKTTIHTKRAIKKIKMKLFNDSIVNTY
ncbi:hypothetical protein KIS4809_2729 [Bacillus sp. ZZV12-4809]|nr:hypothetical protein KIS4809_2729 [Bacillus sp. ZZV12-4809]